METLKCWSSLHGYVMFIFLTTVSKGSACEAPSSPECFRNNSEQSVYMCEWSMTTTESDVIFDLYFSEKKFVKIKETYIEIAEELLIRHQSVDIWVEAHVGNFSCKSPRKSVVLGDTVKFETPQIISVSWVKNNSLRNNISLIWKAAENHQASAEVRFRRDGHPTESWEKISTYTTMMTAQSSPQVPTSQKGVTLEYKVIVVNLLKHSAYQFQIRHQSTQARNPLWSKWSPVLMVPAELEHEPEVNIKTKVVNGSREVTLTWKPMPHAAAVGGVTYLLEDTQSSHGCPCKRTKRGRHHNNTVIYVSYSAVNISLTARNIAGYSPSALIEVPAVPAADLKPCDNMTLDEKLKKKTCKQWYELRDQDSRPQNVITLASKKKKERERVKKRMQDYVRYLHFEHTCDNEKPRTVKMCLFYKKEGAPHREPQVFAAINDAHNSALLSWKATASEHQQGFLTHYSLCSVKVSSQEGQEGCRNISASLTEYCLENLEPGAKYNISLAAVTRAGEGPKAIINISIQPEKKMNVWLSFGLLIAFFLGTTMCTVILKRIKNKIFPPVPKPVIPDFNLFQPENQELLEGKEEVNDLTLLQLHPKVKSVPEDAGETTTLRGEWDDGSDKHMENERGVSRMSGGTSDESPGSTDQALRSSREGEITDLEQEDNEIAMLVYRNGLVFDVKAD
ncbi:interleukin-12 receptor subunit beta-1 isoform X2 [Seriola aureovittata]|uniref:interleukin-12 receptor subunit beta-1 isoform X2 n=1 Tax=Seriola aureovittata TaxID=2871759 RepID=UPI0024BD74EE|nr:interleukin-12 receptor subunit beta-1 isoform X2 [Seriola aureovittata]